MMHFFSDVMNNPVMLAMFMAIIGMVLSAVPTYPERGYAGMLHGNAHGYQADSRMNSQGNTAGIYEWTITAANSTAYTLLINGVAITITSDGSATTAEIRDLLIAAIQANPFTNNLVIAESGGAAILRVTERFPLNGAVTVSDSDANLALATATAHANGEPVPAGIAMIQGSTDNSCRLMVDASSVPIGVAIFDHSMAQPLTIGVSGEALFPPNSTIALLRNGEILVRVEEAVTPASPVFVRHTASGANTQKGAFRASADTATAVAWTLARYKTSASAGGLAVLSVMKN